MNQPADKTFNRTARTMAMKSGGYYSERTRGAKDVIDNATGMLLEAVDAIAPPSDHQPIRLADLVPPTAVHPPQPGIAVSSI